MSTVTGNPRSSFAASTGTAETDSLQTGSATDPKGSSQRPGWRVALFNAVSFPVVLAMIVLAVLFMFSRKAIADPDIWWHLHNADHLVRQHSLPNTDQYSFTVPGHPWMNHEWLAELPYYFAWRKFGLSGVNAVLFTALALIFLGALYLAYRESGHYKASIIAACFGLFLGSVSFGPRTILFGYLELVLLLILLQRFRQKGGVSCWLIPPLFGLWINTHGSWFIGMILFSMIFSAGWITEDWGMLKADPWPPSQRRKILLCWGASIGALFINPYGARLVFYPLDLAFRQKLNIAHVAEWVSVDFHDLRGKIVLVLLIVLLVAAISRPRRWTYAELGVVLFALYSGLTYVRFLFLLGIVVAPILAKTFEFVPRYRREMDTPIVNACVIVLIISGVAYFWPRENKLEAVVGEQYPVQAMTYLQSHPIDGPMLNFYLWGGYVNWRNPAIKVFIDSRVDIFEYSGVLRDFLDVLALKEPNRIIERYKIRYVLFPRNEPLNYVLEHDAKWQVIYSDSLSEVFQKKDSAAPTLAGARN